MSLVAFYYLHSALFTCYSYIKTNLQALFSQPTSKNINHLSEKKNSNISP